MISKVENLKLPSAILGMIGSNNQNKKVGFQSVQPLKQNGFEQASVSMAKKYGSARLDTIPQKPADNLSFMGLGALGDNCIKAKNGKEVGRFFNEIA